MIGRNLILVNAQRWIILNPRFGGEFSIITATNFPPNRLLSEDKACLIQHSSSLEKW